MTPEAQRIAIAEACGWKHDESDRPTNNGTLWINPQGKVNYQCQFPEFPAELPNYPADLNAMHEAEKVLSPAQRCQYTHLLRKYHETYPTMIFGEISSTPELRAEMLLRAIGKWEDKS